MERDSRCIHILAETAVVKIGARYDSQSSLAPPGYVSVQDDPGGRCAAGEMP